MAELLLEDLSSWEMTCIIGVAAGIQFLFALKDYLSPLSFNQLIALFFFCVWAISEP